jgi:hypothetical protein
MDDFCSAVKSLERERARSELERPSVTVIVVAHGQLGSRDDRAAPNLD